jgi:general secretion pathway protein N
MAWVGLVLGVLLALLLFAPARWLANGIGAASAGQVMLVNTRGSVWNGQADLLLSGGEGSRSQTVLPKGLSWRMRPAFVAGGPGLAVQLVAPCCTPQALGLQLRPRWGGVEVRLAASRSQWPAELLSGLGTPWNTLRMEGQLALQTEGLALRWAEGRLNMNGALALDALNVASRLSTLRPLGSYRLELQALPDGHSASLALQTLQGDLQMQGTGQWVGGRLRFQGEASAAPGRELTLANLLNIIGRRDGTRSLINIG